MVIGVCSVDVQIPASGSLKSKRQVLQSVLARVRQEFNVSVAEVDHQDSWQLATVGVACVSTDAAYAHGLLECVVHFIEGSHPGIVLLDYEIELL